MSFSRGHGKSPKRTSNEMALAMRKDRRTGMSFPALGRKYGVHTNTASRICNEESHKNIAMPEAEIKSDDQLKAEGREATRKLCLEKGWEIPDDLKTPAELEAVGRAQKADEQIEILVQGGYSCESCGVAENGMHLESCQDASGGTLVRQ